ncbi:MAG: GNAT family N-acetyltransferase [Pseudomonadota bacterium]
MAFEIRPATRADLPTLKRFEQGIIAAERPYDPTIKPDPVSYYDLAALIDAPDAEVLVAEADGAIIASGSARTMKSTHYFEHDHHAYLGFMWVEPEWRGKGANPLIIDALIDWSRAMGLTEIQLTVYAENTGAIRAYEKAGFEPFIARMRLSAQS